MVHQRNQWIRNQSGLISSFDLMIQSDIGSLKEIKDDLICRKKQTFDDEVLLFVVSAAT